ncbi:MAG: hypothetical protein ACLTSX_03390 [Collinsella sp.]
MRPPSPIPHEGSAHRSSMGLLTALSLSFNNLMTQEGPHHHDGLRRARSASSASRRFWRSPTV